MFSDLVAASWKAATVVSLPERAEDGDADALVAVTAEAQTATAIPATTSFTLFIFYISLNGCDFTRSLPTGPDYGQQ
ncbi:hypothetical protein GCM10010324_37870 [Streptomyces hiroshimensis]|uniref:Uncharacterized protein n=1 Tax=Streptomyces hiroshimensis TaxID=66424 RepID=A0ABQ2YLR4_9ACTN|nr:hypothetical protein GCM10010324_37870 [Streptomyces hiroshimensis]